MFVLCIYLYIFVMNKAEISLYQITINNLHSIFYNIYSLTELGFCDSYIGLGGKLIVHGSV